MASESRPAMPLRRRGKGVPCLVVDDLVAALDYYREVLAFEVVATQGGDPPRSALLDWRGAPLLLQQSAVPGERYSHRRHTLRSWDALLLLDDVDEAYRRLSARGAELLVGVGATEISWRNFEAQDPWGNVLCFGLAPPGRLDTLLPALRDRLPARPRARWQDWRSACEERPHLEEFQAFHERLERRRDIYYMFFSGGLLQWVVHAAAHVPPQVNLVLLGSALDEDEQEWVRERLKRPFHHIRLPVDDVTVWEFLFATGQQHFGWLDIDCFVLEERLFGELAAIDPRVSMNCVWSWDSGYGFPIANTHLLFLNADAIRAVRSRALRASPSQFDWRGDPRRIPQRRCYSRVPTARERRLLLEVVPADERGRPRFPADHGYFDTLVTYQLLARAVGYPIHRVRQLARRTGAVTGTADDPASWPEDVSDEVFHLYGVTYYNRYFYEPEIRALYLAAEHAMLQNVAAWLPPAYRARERAVAAQLEQFGMTPAAARELFRQHLIRARGLNEHSADRILEQPALSLHPV